MNNTINLTVNELQNLSDLSHTMEHVYMALTQEELISCDMTNISLDFNSRGNRRITINLGLENPIECENAYIENIECSMTWGLDFEDFDEEIWLWFTYKNNALTNEIRYCTKIESLYYTDICNAMHSAIVQAVCIELDL